QAVPENFGFKSKTPIPDDRAKRHRLQDGRSYPQTWVFRCEINGRWRSCGITQWLRRQRDIDRVDALDASFACSFYAEPDISVESPRLRRALGSNSGICRTQVSPRDFVRIMDIIGHNWPS